MKKSELRRTIRKEIRKLNKTQKIINEDTSNGIKYFKDETLSIKIPSFTFKAKFSFSDTEEWKGKMVRQPVDIEIDTFDNNIEDVLSDVITKAIVTEFNKKMSKKTDIVVTDKKARIGGFMSSFPKIFHLNKK